MNGKADIPIDFFRDEVRCGFRIPTAIKQAWAAQLKVLAAIDRVCEKHGIAYHAEWGTLLGTVRHRGFIPWDDDLDIGMKREDYIRFRAVADKELPAGYVIHDYERQEDHWLFLARVVNRDRFSFDPEELDRWHNYPWLAGIDIFVLDYCYRDPAQEERRRKEVLKLIALADGIVEGRFSAQTVMEQLCAVEEQYGREEGFPEILRSDPMRKGRRETGVGLYRLAERQMARVPAEESDRLVQMFPWGLKGVEGLPKDWYADTVRLPYEMTAIPVPAAYEAILRHRYGDGWMTPHKVWGGHDYPSFEGQRENLQKVADFPLPAYRWEPRMRDAQRNRCVADTSNSEGDSPGKHADTGSSSGGMDQTKTRNRVILLPVGPREWQGMEAYYRQLADAPNNEITVVPLPLLPKNALGEVTATDEEMLAADRFTEYPQELPLAHWYDIDPAELHPDRIVIQDPYDGENPCLTVPPIFYAEYLRQCTGELIYLPAFTTAEFGENDRNDQYNLKHYVTAPGVVWADRVLVQSENIRQQYIRALTAFSEAVLHPLWERKVTVVSRDVVT